MLLFQPGDVYRVHCVYAELVYCKLRAGCLAGRAGFNGVSDFFKFLEPNQAVGVSS